MKGTLLVVFIATVMSGIFAAAVLLDGPAALVMDAKSYWEFGDSVANCDVLLQTYPIAYRTPGYPWFIAFCQTVAGPRGLGMVIGLQGAMCALLVPISAWIAWRLSQPRCRDVAAISAAILTMVGISRMYFARAVLGESLFIFVMMLHIACVAGLVTGQAKIRWGLMAGFLLGAMILVRPIGQWLWIAHLFLVVPFVVSRGKCGTSDAVVIRIDWSLVRSLVLMGVIALLMIAPWWSRNAKMFGRPFLTEFVGRNIWIVTFQDQAGAGLPMPSTPEAILLRDTVLKINPTADLTYTWEVSNTLSRSGMADDEIDRLMRTVAMQATKNGIGIWTERCGRRLVNFFRCIADEPPTFIDSVDIPVGQWYWRAPSRLESFIRSARFSPNLVANMFVSGAYFFGWSCLLLNRRSRVTALWLGSMIMYFAVVTAAIEIPAYRYRLVVEPLMAIVGGCAIAILCSRHAKIKLIVDQTAG